MCVISEKYGNLKDVTEETIRNVSFWLWHLFSFASRSIVGASLVMVGCELKRVALGKAKKNRRGGGEYILSVLLIIVGVISGLFNYSFINLHFAFIRNPILFYVSAISTTFALLIIGRKIHPPFITWCGKESLLLILAQTGIAYTCLVIAKVVNSVELPYVAVLFIAIAALVASLIISYFTIKLIHSTFLKIVITPPEKKEVK